MGVRSRAVFDLTYLITNIDDDENFRETLAAADHFDAPRRPQGGAENAHPASPHRMEQTS